MEAMVEQEDVAFSWEEQSRGSNRGGYDPAAQIIFVFSSAGVSRTSSWRERESASALFCSKPTAQRRRRRRGWIGWGSRAAARRA